MNDYIKEDFVKGLKIRRWIYVFAAVWACIGAAALPHLFGVLSGMVFGYIMASIKSLSNGIMIAEQFLFIEEHYEVVFEEDSDDH